MDNKIEQFENILIDIRKAHRLLFEYQTRMLSLVNFIRHKLDFNSFLGVKHFSRPISIKKNGYQAIHDNMWAWDFIYSYLYEYFIGYMELENGYSTNLSIVQYSDTGYFDNENDDRCNTDSFTTEEEAMSKILFILELIPPRCKSIRNTPDSLDQYIMNKELASKKHTHTILYPKGEGKNVLAFYSIPLSKFITEKSATKSLKEYIEFCNNNDLVEFSLI